MRGALGTFIWVVGGGAALGLGALAGLSYFAWQEEAAAPAGPPRTCPPIVETPARAAGGPVDDVFGVRPGFSVEAAQAYLLCADEGYEFRFDAYWHTPVQAGSQERQVMHAETAGRAVILGLVGGPGQERVVELWRDENFGGEAAPTTESLEAGLIAQYGPPHAERTTQFRRLLAWSFAPDGAPIASGPGGAAGLFDRMQTMLSGKPTLEGCMRNAKLGWLEPPAFSDACGVTIQAEIEGQLDARERASRLRLVVVDQASMAARLKAFRAGEGAAR